MDTWVWFPLQERREMQHCMITWKSCQTSRCDATNPFENRTWQHITLWPHSGGLGCAGNVWFSGIYQTLFTVWGPVEIWIFTRTSLWKNDQLNDFLKEYLWKALPRLSPRDHRRNLPFPTQCCEQRWGFPYFFPFKFVFSSHCLMWIRKQFYPTLV